MVCCVIVLSTAVIIGCVYAEINSGPSREKCWSGGNGKAAQWWDDGSRIDRGKYWYECRNGELRPMGCFTEKGERIPVTGSYSTDGYVIECALDESDTLFFKFIGCTDGARQYIPGETWEDPQNMYWFECKREGDAVHVQVGGCISHDKSRRLAIGERYDFGDYECQKKYNGSVQMCSVGCVHNNAHYKVGEQWDEGDFIFYCKLNGGRTQKICVGCQYRNKRLYNGDRYERDNIVYQCEVRSDKYGHKPVGCVVQQPNGSTMQKVIGCRWYQTTLDSKVEQTCVLEGDKTHVKTLGCIFVDNGYDRLFLYPGTYTVWTQSMDKQPIGVACREPAPEQSPRLETFDLMQIAFKTQGLKYDKPRGK